MARHKNYFDKQHDKEVMKEFEAWVCDYFQFDKEQFTKFMRFIELMHGYQTINVKKVLLYLKAHKEAIHDGKIDRVRVKEIAVSYNVAERVADNYIYHYKPSIIELVNWEQTIS